MSLCVGNGLCALLELYLSFLSFTRGQEKVLVRFVAVICVMGLSCTGGGSPGLWGGTAGAGISPGLGAGAAWSLLALTTFVT